MHQRRCRVHENMDLDQPPDFENSNTGSCDVANDNPEVAIESLQTLLVKPGSSYQDRRTTGMKRITTLNQFSLLSKLKQTRLMKQYGL